MPVKPADILKDIDPLTLPADAPPAEANYREADLGGIACAFCSKFKVTDFREEDGISVPVGVCEMWESKVDGVMVSDGFASSSPPLDKEGQEVWGEFSAAEQIAQYDEIHCAGTAITEKDGKLYKGILRTGHWPVTPTPFGKIKKPLTIVATGKSDPAKGIISLDEIYSNFKAGNGPKKIQIPLSDEEKKDHKNTTALNTGFVRDLKLEEEDGVTHLVAEMDFTEPEVKAKALRGTYSDVSSGVPHHTEYGAFLEHVCITNQPFIDNLKPWLVASDAPAAVADAEIVHHVLETPASEVEPKKENDPSRVRVTYGTVLKGVDKAIEEKFGATGIDYKMLDANDETVTLEHKLSGTTWTIGYTVEDAEVILAPFDEWTIVEKQDEGTAEPPPETAPRSPHPSTGDADLDAAREDREMRLAASAHTTTNRTGDAPMTVISRAELDALGLNDEQRAAFLKLHNENTTLAASNKEADAAKRIKELEDLGFSDRPGALKLYRQVFLSDDGGPAIVLLSDDGSEAKEKKSALEILDAFIDAQIGSTGKVEFSDQHIQQPGDVKPPINHEKPPLDQRVKDATDFLFPNGRK